MSVWESVCSEQHTRARTQSLRNTHIHTPPFSQSKILTWQVTFTFTEIQALLLYHCVEAKGYFEQEKDRNKEEEAEEEAQSANGAKLNVPSISPTISAKIGKLCSKSRHSVVKLSGSTWSISN